MKIKDYIEIIEESIDSPLVQSILKADAIIRFNTMMIETYATNIESKLIKSEYYYYVKELDKKTYLEQCEINNSLKLYLKESEKLKKIAEDFV